MTTEHAQRTIEEVFSDDLQLYTGKSGVYRTCFHAVRKLKQTTTTNQKEIAPHLRRWCADRKLDESVYLVRLCNILDDGIETHAPLLDAVERLQGDSFRIEMPDDIVDDDDLKKLATVCYYLDNDSADGCFFLSCRKAGFILDKSREHGRQCLKKLVRHNVIKLETQGVSKPGADASIYSYISSAKRANLSQETQETQTTHQTKEKTKSDPITEIDSQDEINIASPGGGGGDASLFQEHKPTTGNIGTPDELIEMAVGDRIKGVLGEIPYQETISEPYKTLPSTEKEKPTGSQAWLDKYTPERLQAAQEQNPHPCDQCNKPRGKHTEEEKAACWEKEIAGRTPPPTKKKTASGNYRDEINAIREKKLPGNEQDEAYAKITAKHLDSLQPRTINAVGELIKKYGMKALCDTTCEIINELSRGTTFSSNFGILKHRIESGAKHVA
jgi:hypothetical protein